jgi:hypothetical protein
MDLPQQLQEYRALTYLRTDEDDFNIGYDNNETTITTTTESNLGLVIGFSILSAVFFVITVVVIRLSTTCHAFYEWNAIRLLMPAVACFLGMETATLAVQSSWSTMVVVDPWAITLFMVSSTIAPGIFLISFVITFLAYRTRSMPFCFVYRGPGRQDHVREPWRDDDEEVLQPLVRPAVLVVAIRLFALGLLILNLMVNFDVMWSEPSLAGRTGWGTVILSDPNDDNNNNNPSMDHIILALVPMALVSLSCLYFSLLLWRYGCELSLVIYSSGVINPWLTPVLGSLAMIIGQLFGPDLFLITSNSGILLYMLSLVRILYEAQRDLQVSGDLGNFLDVLGNDNVTRTQFGVEKDGHQPGDEDTLSSGQHQQWVLNESNKREVTTLPSAVVHDTEIGVSVRVPSKKESYTLQASAKSPRQTTSILTSNLPSPSRNLSPPDKAAESTKPDHDGVHHHKAAAATTTTTASRAIESPTKNTNDHDNDDQSDSVNPDTDHSAQRVQGITVRPGNLKEIRRGQRPKGKYVVH